MADSKLMSLDNPVFWNYVGCSTVCLVKMAIMAPLVGRQRRLKKIAPNPEDAEFKGDDWKFDTGDQDVERVRRSHLNDLENIPMFVIMGGMYVMTGPNPMCAITHFRLFAASRILYTVLYLKKSPPTYRGFAFLTGLTMTMSMAVQIFLKLMKA